MVVIQIDLPRLMGVLGISLYAGEPFSWQSTVRTVFPGKISLDPIRHSLYYMLNTDIIVGRIAQSVVRGPGFDTRSGNILSFLLPLFQEGQLSVTGESMCTKYWLTA